MQSEFISAELSLPESQIEIIIKVEGIRDKGYYSSTFNLFFVGENAMPYEPKQVHWKNIIQAIGEEKKEVENG